MMKFKIMKQTLKALLVGTTFVMATVSANAFTEGKDYMVLSNPIPNAQGTLIKVFSYDCPFCYKYEKAVMDPLLKQLGNSVKYEAYHLETKGKYGVEASQLFAAVAVKEPANFKKVKMAYYTAYHDKKERWDSGADAFLKTGLDSIGWTKAQLDEALKDAAVQAELKKWKDASYEVAKIQGVPAYVVNGKYLIYTKSIQSVDSMAQLIKELAAK